MRSLVFFFAASVAIHTVIAAPSYGPFFAKGEKDGTVFISYVEPAPEKPQKKAKVLRALIPANKPRDRFFSKKAAVRESAELLTDPQMGKVFHSYFVRVKEKIHQVARRHAGEHPGKGFVALFFVLRSDGALDKISVAEKESSAGTEMRTFAVDCVKASAPFDPFPRELDPAKIAFRVTVRFNEIAV